MKKVVMADCLGLCSGVERALDIVNKTKGGKGSGIYVLGSLVHNPQVVEKLKLRGIEFIDTADNISCGTVIISAHGAAQEIISRLKKKGIKIIDATCPLVKKLHSKAIELEEKGHSVVILGDREHAEVRAVTGSLSNAVAVSDAKELLDILKDRPRIALLSQTTQVREHFDRAAMVLGKLSPGSMIYNTICNATRLRQDSARSTAKNVDMMLVIGGYNSANTRRLREICSRIAETRHVETADELNGEWFRNSDIRGVTAGASTPDWIINEVVERVKKFD